MDGKTANLTKLSGSRFYRFLVYHKIKEESTIEKKHQPVRFEVCIEEYNHFTWQGNVRINGHHGFQKRFESATYKQTGG